MINFRHFKSLISHMCFVCFKFCLLCCKLELIKHSVGKTALWCHSLFKKFGNVTLYCFAFTPEAPIRRFHCLGVNLKKARRIWKDLYESSDDYKGTTAQKPHSDCSDKIIFVFLGEVQAIIDNDPSKSIRIIVKILWGSEFLIRQVVHEDIRYFS